jgi:hypothetical protein
VARAVDREQRDRDGGVDDRESPEERRIRPKTRSKGLDLSI